MKDKPFTLENAIKRTPVDRTALHLALNAGYKLAKKHNEILKYCIGCGNVTSQDEQVVYANIDVGLTLGYSDFAKYELKYHSCNACRLESNTLPKNEGF